MKRLQLIVLSSLFGFAFVVIAAGQENKGDSERQKTEQQDRSARQDLQRGQRGPGNNRQRRGGMEASALKVADMAPTFKLKSLDGKQEIDLASFRGKKPVVLFFGSYT